MALSEEEKDALERQLIGQWRAKRGQIEEFAADGTWRLIEPHWDKPKPRLPDVGGQWNIQDDGRLLLIWDISKESKRVAPPFADGNYLCKIAFEGDQLLQTDPLGSTGRLTRVGMEARPQRSNLVQKKASNPILL